MLFNKRNCIIQDLYTRREVAQGVLEDGSYKLRGKKEVLSDVNRPSMNKFVSVSCRRKNVNENLVLLHTSLGHASLSKMKYLDFCHCKNLKSYYCDTCCIAKHPRLPLKSSQSMGASIFNLVHIDLWGPYRVQNINASKYLLIVLDDYSRATWTFLLANKELVKNTIIFFLAYVENQFETKVKTIRSDNGTEILQEGCPKVFKEKGIVHQTSIPGVATQNGRVERKHRHLLKTARSIKLHANLPKYLWGECILSATHN